jgi:hypothetical protein
MKMARLLHCSSPSLPQSFGNYSPSGCSSTGILMIIQMKTKRRWILSILETVGDATDTRVLARATVRQSSRNTMVVGQKGFAMRLKTATRPMGDASR